MRTISASVDTFSGILIPFTGKTITQTETDFQNLNRALKQRVESWG